MSSTLTVYRASAGSGKTFTLAVEYIAQLLEQPAGQEFRHILAVTFTNKATAEMKDRILQQLYAIAHSLPQGEQYLAAVRSRLQERGIERSIVALRQGAQRVLGAILHDYNHFRVETIDSFFQSILRHLARELGLTANLEVELNDKEVVSAAVDRIIDSLQHQPAIQQWVLQYVSEQIELNQRWDITRTVKEFAHCIFEESFQNRSTEQRERLSDEGLIRQFRAQMQRIRSQAQAEIVAAVDALEKRIEEGPLGFDGISNARHYVGALQKMRNLEYKEDSVSLPNAANDPMKMLNKAKQKKPHLVAEAEELAHHIGQMLNIYRQGAGQIASARLAASHINPLRLLGTIEEMAGRICSENNQFLLSRTPTLLGEMVEESDAPFVFEKIGTQLRHVMIDEFQDTSHQQWNNFKVLLLENQASGGRDLVVGDVKQSIYRWRNGDWSVLQGIGQEMHHLRPRIVTLDTNYRSRERVIEFNNSFFPRAATLLDGLATGARFRLADIYSDVMQQCPQPDGLGHVAVHLYKRSGRSRPADYEARFVQDMIDRITALQQMGVPTTEMAILVRKRSNGTQLIEAFRRMAPHIRLVSDEAFLLSSSTAVQMIVHALRILSDPQGHDPIPPHYLARHYMQDVLHQATSPALFAAPQAEQCLPPEFRLRQKQLAQMPLYVLCEELYRILSLHQIEGQEPYLFSFYDTLQAHLRTHSSDIRAFLAAWDEGLANQPVACGQMPGLRILTIHQSKGLQFHTVLLPYCDWEIELDRAKEALWCEPDQAPYNTLGLLPVSPCKEMQHSVFASQYHEEHLQKRVDALNTLYVAFTRAECNLYLWGLTSDGLSTSSVAADLIAKSLDMKEADDNELHYEVGEPVALAAKSGGKGAANRLDPTAEPLSMACHSYKAHLDFKQSNDSLRFVRSLGDEPMPEGNGIYIEMGKLIHYVLSQIVHPEEVDGVLRRCLIQGLVTDEQQMKRIRALVMQGLALPQVAPWFAPEVEVINECAILLPNGSSTRPDRVVMRDGEVTVIDFKCGKPWPEHMAQVKGYMHTLAQMYPRHTVRGYLWYIYTARIQQVTLE